MVLNMIYYGAEANMIDHSLKKFLSKMKKDCFSIKTLSIQDRIFAKQSRYQMKKEEIYLIRHGDNSNNDTDINEEVK